MRRQLFNVISVLFSTVKFALMKLIHGSHFHYEGIQRFSPNTEVIISGEGTMKLGHRVRVHRRSRLTVFSQGVLEIGSGTALGNDVGITCMKSVRIGAGVQIGPGTKIYDHDHDFRAPGGVGAEKFLASPVEIGDNAWIGCNVVILRGTRIGRNCVVAAGAILKGTYPDNAVIVQKRQTTVTVYPFEQREQKKG